MDIKGKKVTIIGCKKSGVGTAKLVKKLKGIPFVSEFSNDKKLHPFIEEIKKEEIDFEIGGHSERVFDTTLIVVSPGVPSDSEVIKEAKKRGIKIISEVEFASIFCKGKIIAITGTNGKTTTTSLIGHLLNNAGIRSYVAGNIGIIAFSEIALNVKENEVVVLEVSSFQLDFIETFKPFISMILNITPDHLNRYENSFEKYIYSKYRVFMNQDSNDYLILNSDDKVLNQYSISSKANIKYFSLKKKVEDGAFLSHSVGSDTSVTGVSNSNIELNFRNGEKFVCSTDNIRIPGEHNLANAMASILCAKILGVSDSKIIKGLNSFQGVEHRIEYVDTINGVEYFNDSKATNVDSVWYALKSFEKNIILILGGLDKGNDYNQIKELVQHRVKKIFAIGNSAEKVYDFFKDIKPVEKKESLGDCLQTAYSEAIEGDVVLLSPACASFDMFDSYEHRGRVFKEGVKSLR